MKNETNPSRPLVDQIIDEMLVRLEKFEEFDTAILHEIENLANDGKFKNINQISSVLTSPRCEE